MPMASFGVGGEFGQGGKYDNGERFDLRLPYADRGWVDTGSTTRSTEPSDALRIKKAQQAQRKAERLKAEAATAAAKTKAKGKGKKEAEASKPDWFGGLWK
jgi:hypothetical protein